MLKDRRRSVSLHARARADRGSDLLVRAHRHACGAVQVPIPSLGNRTAFGELDEAMKSARASKSGAYIEIIGGKMEMSPALAFAHGQLKAMDGDARRNTRGKRWADKGALARPGALAI